jgi:hypothetical protein
VYRYEITGELLAHSEEGRKYRLIQYTKVLNLADAHTPTRWEPVGPDEYRTDSGERVIQLSENDFLICGPKRVRIRSLPR